VHDYLELWAWDGTLERIHHALYVAVREQVGVKRAPRWRASNPKLSAVAVASLSGSGFAAALERAIARSGVELIEAKVVEPGAE
jgi:hypothetical protein